MTATCLALREVSFTQFSATVQTHRRYCLIGINPPGPTPNIQISSGRAVKDSGFRPLTCAVKSPSFTSKVARWTRHHLVLPPVLHVCPQSKHGPSCRIHWRRPVSPCQRCGQRRSCSFGCFSQREFSIRQRNEPEDNSRRGISSHSKTPYFVHASSLRILRRGPSPKTCAKRRALCPSASHRHAR